jgi:hypothetical protein
MDGSNPSILTKPCCLVLSKLATWQNFAKKNTMLGSFYLASFFQEPTSMFQKLQGFILT